MEKLKLSTANLVIVVSGAVMFIASFLAFNKISDPVDQRRRHKDRRRVALLQRLEHATSFSSRRSRRSSAWSWPRRSRWPTFAPQVKLPDAVLGFTWTQVHLVLGFQATIMMLAFLIQNTGLDKGIGLFLMLLAAIGLLVGAVLRMQEQAKPADLNDVLVAIGARARERGAPSLAEAISATGGVALALGILLITIDLRADDAGPRGAGRAFRRARVGGLPRAFAAARRSARGGRQPRSCSASPARSVGCCCRARTASPTFGRSSCSRSWRGSSPSSCRARRDARSSWPPRPCSLWLWILGEVADTGAYSAAPIPSPPAHTVFSLQSFATARRGGRARRSRSERSPVLDRASSAATATSAACRVAVPIRREPGSDFQAFASTCGNTAADRDVRGPRRRQRRVRSVADPRAQPDRSDLEHHERQVARDRLGLDALRRRCTWAHSSCSTAPDGAAWRLRSWSPAFIALVSGTQSLGNAAHHAWVGGLLTFAAGLAIGLIGDLTQRRFTTWAGALIVALGALTIALDAAHISRSVSNGDVKLAGPGLIVGLFGVGLTATAFVIAHLLGARPAAATPMPMRRRPTPPPPQWPSLPSDLSPAAPPPT